MLRQGKAVFILPADHLGQHFNASATKSFSRRGRLATPSKLSACGFFSPPGTCYSIRNDLPSVNIKSTRKRLWPPTVPYHIGACVFTLALSCCKSSGSVNGFWSVWRGRGEPTQKTQLYYDSNQLACARCPTFVMSVHLITYRPVFPLKYSKLSPCATF